jgi:hypothetical protein
VTARLTAPAPPHGDGAREPGGPPAARATAATTPSTADEGELVALAESDRAHPDLAAMRGLLCGAVLGALLWGVLVALVLVVVIPLLS